MQVCHHLLPCINKIAISLSLYDDGLILSTRHEMFVMFKSIVADLKCKDLLINLVLGSKVVVLISSSKPLSVKNVAVNPLTRNDIVSPMPVHVKFAGKLADTLID